jgi:hypothetical protein
LDWTDRHGRRFRRFIVRRASWYTETATTGALLHGDVPRHLDFSAEEHPVALPMGGSATSDLAHHSGDAEVNLSCGCPSERAQRGAFGAGRMAEPALVADHVNAVCDATTLPVAVKHRIGIDPTKSYASVRDFIGTVAGARRLRRLPRPCAQGLAGRPDEATPSGEATAPRHGETAEVRLSGIEDRAERRRHHRRTDRAAPAACRRLDGGATGAPRARGEGCLGRVNLP